MGEEAMGAVGRLVVATRGAAGPGEVILTVGGTREAYIAESAEPIARGETVLVIAVGRHRHVEVVRWHEFPMPGPTEP